MLNYVFLSDDFYRKFSNDEFLYKRERPYVFIKIELNGLDVAIPIRSNLNHNYGLVTCENSCQRSGLDFSKAVIISDIKYLYHPRRPIRIDRREHRFLEANEYIIEREFMKYIHTYIKALKARHVKRNQYIVDFSTLKYFHRELGIE